MFSTVLLEISMYSRLVGCWDSKSPIEIGLDYIARRVPLSGWNETATGTIQYLQNTTLVLFRSFQITIHIRAQKRVRKLYPHSMFSEWKHKPAFNRLPHNSVLPFWITCLNIIFMHTKLNSTQFPISDSKLKLKFLWAIFSSHLFVQFLLFILVDINFSAFKKVLYV